MDRDAYQAETARILTERIESLRKMTFSEASLLPAARGEDAVVAGQKATITVFRQDSPYQLSGKILVTVLVARERWFGIAAHHTERGLVFSPDESVREAAQLELQNSGG